MGSRRTAAGTRALLASAAGLAALLVAAGGPATASTDRATERAPRLTTTATARADEVPAPSPGRGLAVPVAARVVGPVVGPVVGAVTAGPPRRPPVPGAVVRPFVAPAHEYGPGHRGVDLGAGPGAQVGSPAAGTVTFAGQVAGRGVVVVAHAGGVLTSLEPVTATVTRGTAVSAGSAVGVVAATPHTGCAGGCVHWGVRVQGRYVDPLWWLGRGRAVRLLPLTGPW